MVTHGNRLEEEVFDFVRESEEAALGKAAETVGEFLPVEVPVVSELIEGILEFTEAVLKTQREFAQRILEQTRNVTTRTKPKATGPARRSRTTRASKGPQAVRVTRPAKQSVRAAP